MRGQQQGYEGARRAADPAGPQQFRSGPQLCFGNVSGRAVHVIVSHQVEVMHVFPEEAHVPGGMISSLVQAR